MGTEIRGGMGRALGSEAWVAEQRWWKTGSFSGRLARFP